MRNARVRGPDTFREQADADARSAAVDAMYDVLALAAQVSGGTVDSVSEPKLRSLARMATDHLLKLGRKP